MVIHKRITPEKYKILKALFEESLIEKYKNAHLARCVGTLMSRGNHWPVIGISEKALQCIKDADYVKPKKTIQRGHLISRSESINLLFRNREEFVSIDEFEEIYTFYDKTILMTNDENKKTKTPPEFIKFPPHDPEIFLSNYIGFAYGKREMLFLKTLQENFYSDPKRKLHSILDIFPKNLDSHKKS